MPPFFHFPFFLFFLSPFFLSSFFVFVLFLTVTLSFILSTILSFLLSLPLSFHPLIFEEIKNFLRVNLCGINVKPFSLMVQEWVPLNSIQYNEDEKLQLNKIHLILFWIEGIFVRNYECVQIREQNLYLQLTLSTGPSCLRYVVRTLNIPRSWRLFVNRFFLRFFSFFFRFCFGTLQNITFILGPDREIIEVNMREIKGWEVSLTDTGRMCRSRNDRVPGTRTKGKDLLWKQSLKPCWGRGVKFIHDFTVETPLQYRFVGPSDRKRTTYRFLTLIWINT